MTILLIIQPETLVPQGFQASLRDFVRISFYTPFYVYQYATSFAASFKLYKDVKENVPGAFDKYIGLLSSGGSKYPMEQAREAGVDFTQKETFMAVVERMDYLLKVLEDLLK